MVILEPALLPEKTSSARAGLSPTAARQASGAYVVITDNAGATWGVRAGNALSAPPRLSGSLAVSGLSGAASFRVAIDGVPVVEKVVDGEGTLLFAKSGLATVGGAHVVSVAWRGGGAPVTLEGFDALVLSVTADDWGTDVRDPNEPA